MKSGIVAFAFGAPKTILSNQRIAKIASKKARGLRAPVYTQLDILIDEGIEVEFTEEQPGNPPPTLRFARGAVQWASKNGIEELWIVAAMPHIWRCIRDLYGAIQEAKVHIEVYTACEEIAQFSEDEWFCADSTQKRTQSRANWVKRECILKIIPFFIYKHIAN